MVNTSPYHSPESELPMDLSDSSMYTPLPRTVEEENSFIAETDEDEDSDTQYLDLKPMINIMPTTTLDEMDDLRKWLRIHPDSWATEEVLGWITHVAQKTPEIDLKLLHMERFRMHTGLRLRAMTVHDFLHLEPHYGTYLYEAFQDVLEQYQLLSPVSLDSNIGYDQTHEPSYLDLMNCELHDISPNDPMFMSELSPEPPFMTMDNFGRSIRHASTSELESGYGTDGSTGGEFTSDLYNPEIPQSSVKLPPFTSFMKGNGYDLQIPSVVTNPSYTEPSAQKVSKRGRPRKNFANFTEEGIPQKSHRGRKQGQTSKGSHLWEFVRDMLLDPKCNPTVIRWECKEEGVFRFVKSEQVAKMWGNKKNNATMTYEKLSRAMRFCRTSKFFAEVPKDRNFPKKLCFRFGPKASGWEDL